MTITDDIKKLKETHTADQVLAAFGIPISNGKTYCRWHRETQPSLAVYPSGVKCFGCGRYLNTFDLARELLFQTTHRPVDIFDVLEWFKNTDFSKYPKGQYLAENKYEGPIDRVLVDYWHDYLTDEHYARLENERGLTRDSVDLYRLGYDPYRKGFVIPFWRGEPGNSEIDIVQFRLDSGNPKYIGMAGHNRAAVINAHLLTQRLPYLIVFFGAFDPLLALQDGLYAVGTNGSTVWKKEPERLKQLFRNQQNIVVVPDNSPQEIPEAIWFAQQVQGRVKTYPSDLAEGTDYIKYRKVFSRYQFMRDITELYPKMEAAGYANEVYNYIAGNVDSMPVVPQLLSADDISRAVSLVESDLKQWGTIQSLLYNHSGNLQQHIEIARSLVLKDKTS